MEKEMEKKRPLEKDCSLEEGEMSKKQRNLGEPSLADRLEIRRKKLETRYLGLKFIDDDAPVSEGPKVIKKIEYEEEDAVWVAICESIENSSKEELKYYLNATSGMDEMIERYRKKMREKKKNLLLKKRPASDLEPSTLVGTRIEVCWEICDDDNDDDDNIQHVWWRAQILRHCETKHTLRDDEDEATLDLYKIRYIPRPELGEPESIESKVCFLSKRALIEIDNDNDEIQLLQWRLEGSDDQIANLDEIVGEDNTKHPPVEEDFLLVNTNNIDAFVDSILGEILQGNLLKRFSALDRDKQCFFADYILKAKNKFKSAIHAHIEQKKLQNGAENSNLLQISNEDMKLIIGSISQDFGKK